MKSEINKCRSEVNKCQDSVKSGMKESMNEMNVFKAEVTNSLASSIGQLTQNFELNWNKVEQNLSEVQVSLVDFKNQVDTKINQVQSDINVNMETRFNVINQQIETVNSNVDTRINSINLQVENVNSTVEARINSINEHIESVNLQVENRVEGMTTALNAHRNELVIHTENVIESRMIEMTDSLNSQFKDMNEQMENLRSLTRIVDQESRVRISELEQDVNKLIDKSGETERQNNQVVELNSESHESPVNLENRSNEPHRVEVRNEISECSHPPVNDPLNLPGPSNDSRYKENSVRLPSNLINEITVPHFESASKQNPMIFLNEIENYFKIKGITDEWKMLIVKNALVGTARSWFSLTIGNQLSYELFRKKFLTFFWCQSRQNEVKSKLNFGKYKVNGKLDPVEYCIELGQLGDLLDPPLNNQEFINAAILHYPDEMKNALIVAKPKDFEELICLLRQLQSRSGNVRSSTPHSSAYVGKKDHKQGSNEPQGEKEAQSKIFQNNNGGARNVDQNTFQNKNSNFRFNKGGNGNMQNNAGNQRNHRPFQNNNFNNNRRFLNRNQNGYESRGNDGKVNRNAQINYFRTGHDNEYSVYRNNRGRNNSSNGFYRNRWFRNNYNNHYSPGWQRNHAQNTCVGPERFNASRDEMRFPEGINGPRVDELINQQNNRKDCTENASPRQVESQGN